MNEMNSSQQRESDDSGVFYGESSEGNYENYRNKNLPEGYTAYNENGKIGELVYDRYSSVYSKHSLQEDKLFSLKRKCSCRNIGWVLNFLFNFTPSITKNLIQGLSFGKSHEYSTYLTNVLFEDPESDRAKKFQDSNSIMKFSIYEIISLQFVCHAFNLELLYRKL